MVFQTNGSPNQDGYWKRSPSLKNHSRHLYLHVELAEHLSPGKDPEGDLVDPIVLHVQGVDGGELRGPAHRVRLEAVPGQREARQVHQAGKEALENRRTTGYMPRYGQARQKTKKSFAFRLEKKSSRSTHRLGNVKLHLQ